MSEAVETIETTESPETVDLHERFTSVYKDNWIYLPGGSICYDFNSAVARMYYVGYCLDAMELWFGKYGAK